MSTPMFIEENFPVLKDARAIKQITYHKILLNLGMRNACLKTRLLLGGAMARGIWSGAISFGLLNIPVSVMSAKEEERLSFKMLDTRNNSQIGYHQYNKATGKEVDRKNIEKAYEYKKNQFVIITDEDFLKANPKATRTIDIEDFVSLEEVDILLFEKPYYLVPGKNGEKGYVLLKKVLAETKKVAVAKFVLRSKQHLVVIMARGDYLILEMLRFSHEVQEIHEATFLDDFELDKIKVSAKEMKAAKSLVDDMTAKWKPDQYKDTYQDELLKYIKKKIKSGDVEEVQEAEEIEETDTNVIDLMPFLQKSLKAGAKKSKKKVVKKTTRKKTSKKIKVKE
jgi:DNA end-binding protein Ku